MAFGSIALIALLAGIYSIVLVAGPYQGEIISRVLGLSMLFLAYFAATNLNARLLAVPLVAFLILAPALFVTTAYGNERYDYVSPAEIHGVQFFHDKKPEEPMVLQYGEASRVMVYSLERRIWQFTDNEFGHWRRLDSQSIDWLLFNSTADDPGNVNYILLGERDQESYSFLWGEPDTDGIARIRQSLRFGKVYSSDGFDLFFSENRKQ